MTAAVNRSAPAAANGTPWRSVDHHLDARLSHRGDVSAVRRDRLSDAREEHPELFTRRSARRYVAARALKPGDHIGTLTLVERHARRRQCGGWIWRTQCDCGRAERFVLTSVLMHTLRQGREPTCAFCQRERRALERKMAREYTHEAFRRQWVDYRTLWRPGQTGALMRAVERDLVETFGPRDEPAPSLRFGAIATEPAHADSGTVKAAWRHLGGGDLVAPDLPTQSDFGTLPRHTMEDVAPVRVRPRDFANAHPYIERLELVARHLSDRDPEQAHGLLAEAATLRSRTDFNALADISFVKRNETSRRMQLDPPMQRSGPGWSTTAADEPVLPAVDWSQIRLPIEMRTLDAVIERGRREQQVRSELLNKWRAANPEAPLPPDVDRSIRQDAFFIAYEPPGTTAARQAAYNVLRGLGRR